MASRDIKAKGFTRDPHLFPALRFGPWLPVSPPRPLLQPNDLSSGIVRRMTGQGVVQSAAHRARTRPLDTAGVPHAIPGVGVPGQSPPSSEAPAGEGGEAKPLWKLRLVCSRYCESTADKTRQFQRTISDGCAYLNPNTHTSCKIELPTARRHHG